MSEEQKKLLEQQLWNIANELRGKMGADEFRDYILGFIFYKYLSEKQYLYANTLLETETVKDYANLTNTEDLIAIKEESLIKLGYFLKPNELFAFIAEKGNANIEDESNFILEDLETILNSIEQSTMGTESEDDFNQLFEDLDLKSTKLGRTTEARNTLISKVLFHLNKIDFALEDADADVLGDAYEYLIGQFASGAGKKAGEFYTPQQVSKILAKIVTTGKKRLKNVYDPTCGSGSLLLRVAREVKVDDFYGQELNRTTYNLARMNMILHDVHFGNFDIKQEDTLEEPQHKEKRFEAIVANPPFSAKWKGKDNPLNENDDRFSQYGKLAPTSKADFAFIQHMIYQLADNGTMACVIPHGVLFRGSAESTIRQYLIENLNYLDAVIGLPANIFFGTSIPTAILVFSKCRVHNNDVLFIDASKEFEKDGNKNKLTEDHIDTIISTFRERTTNDKFSYVATLDEIKENDYNLNIPRYVDTFVAEEPINIKIISQYLNEFSEKSKTNDVVIKKYCNILGLPFPDGNNIFLLKQYKKGIMQQIFSQKLRFKDKDGKDYPNWEVVKFSKYIKLFRGSSPRPISKYLTKDEDGVNWIKIGDTKKVKNFIINTVSERITKDGSIKSRQVKVGELILANSMSFGKTYILGLEGCIYDGWFVLREYEKYYNKLFLTQQLNSDFLQRQYKRLSTGGVVQNINSEIVYSTVLGKPKLEEQKKIADFLCAIDTKINLVNTQLENTKIFKKGLLQQMFV